MITMVVLVGLIVGIYFAATLLGAQPQSDNGNSNQGSNGNDGGSIPTPEPTPTFSCENNPLCSSVPVAVQDVITSSYAETETDKIQSLVQLAETVVNIPSDPA